MTSLVEERREVAKALMEAGLVVTLDPRNLTPPCVLVDLPETIGAIGRAGRTMDLVILVIGVPSRLAESGEWMIETTEKIMEALVGRTPEPAYRSTVDTTQNRNTPCYRVVLRSTVNRSEC